jgi:uncharacterized protein YkwD
MGVITLSKRKVALVAVAALLAVGATACFPDTGAPPSDPVKHSVLDAMNWDRGTNGIAPLTWSPKLSVLAGVWAGHLAAANGGLVHQDLGSLVGQGDFAGYHGMGENLLVGAGGMSAGQMEAAWMGSPGHRANILSGGFDIAGVGRAWGPDGRLWVVVDFGAV